MEVETIHITQGKTHQGHAGDLKRKQQKKKEQMIQINQEEDRQVVKTKTQRNQRKNEVRGGHGHSPH